MAVNIDAAGAITTTVSIGGEPVFTVWNPGDDIHDIENESFQSTWLEDEDIHAAAQNWAHQKQDEIPRHMQVIAPVSCNFNSGGPRALVGPALREKVSR